MSVSWTLGRRKSGTRKEGKKKEGGKREVEKEKWRGGRKQEMREEKRKRREHKEKNGGKVKMKKEKCVVYRSQLLGPWRQQPPSFSFTLQPHCPHWHRYNSVLA